MRQTTFINAETAEREWVHFDAREQVLGRLASRIATILMGKDKPTWTPHVDDGDFVVVTNAAEVQLTGRKPETKVYRHHTGYIGGLKERSYAYMMEHHPEDVVRLAVRRMLPKNRLGRRMLKKLKIYRGSDHPHAAQAPRTVTL